MIKTHVYAIAAVASMLCVNAIAQSTATLAGTVSDQGGGVIPGANIVITNLNTEQRRTIQTDGSGLFYAPALPSGNYKVTVTAPGFETVIQPNITLTVGLEQTLNLTLKPSRVQEQVEVLGEPPPVQTSSASVTELVDSQKVRALPLNGRSFDQFQLP